MAPETKEERRKRLKREAAREYYKKNREKVREQVNRWRQANPDKIAAWPLVNREEKLENRRIKYAKDSQYHKDYYIENRERILENQKRWNDANPQAIVKGYMKQKFGVTPPPELIAVSLVIKQIKKELRK